jgi:hypothetical protein
MAAQLAALGPEPALRDTLIAVHVVSGSAAFALGALLAVRRGHRPAQALLYVIALMLTVLFVTGAVILDWHGLTAATRGLFAALLALGFYMVWRGWQARSKLAAARPQLSGALDDLGFTLITLFTGFVVILAGDLGGPVWLVVILGIAAVAVGRRLTSLNKARRLKPAGEGGGFPRGVRPVSGRGGPGRGGGGGRGR